MQTRHVFGGLLAVLVGSTAAGVVSARGVELGYAAAIGLAVGAFVAGVVVGSMQAAAEQAGESA